MALSEGWNQTNVNTLKENIQNTFTTLSNKSDLLDKVYETVGACWKGPDADRYLKEIHTQATTLVSDIKNLYNTISGEIDGVASAWETFQSQE